MLKGNAAAAKDEEDCQEGDSTRDEPRSEKAPESVVRQCWVWWDMVLV